MEGVLIDSIELQCCGVHLLNIQYHRYSVASYLWCTCIGSDDYFSVCQHTHTHRLYVKGIFVGYKRSKHVQQPHTSLLKIEGVENRKDTEFYMGKRVAFVYRAHRKAKQRGHTAPSKYRVVWGRVMRPHGNSGIVRAKFRHNLTPKAMGATLRVVGAIRAASCRGCSNEVLCMGCAGVHSYDLVVFGGLEN